MATVASTIAVIFEAIDKATPTVDGIEKKLGSLQRVADTTTTAFGNVAGNIQSATQPIADLTFGLLKVEGAFIGAGVAMTTFAIKTAGDFDAAFRQITTLFDATEKQTLTFRDAVLEYARGSSKSLGDITAALSAAIGAGVDYTKSIGLIAAAEKLAVSTRADLKGTTETLVSTLNAYGMKTEDAGKVADIFFTTIKDGKIEMTDLASSLAMVTPLAAAAGVDLKEIGAAIAALTASGIKPGQSIEYLRSALTNIIKPSKDASELAQELNIQFDAQALKSRGLAGVLEDVGRATGGNSGQMARLIGDVGGLVAAMALTGPAAEGFKTSLKNMADSAGAVDAAFAKMNGSLEVSAARIASAFKALLVDIGDPLLNEAGGIANAIANVFNVIGVSVREGALKSVVAYIESAMGELQATIEKVAANLPAALGRADFTGFTGGIDVVRQAFGRLFGSIDITSVEGLTAAINLAGTAFLGLSKFTAGVIDSFKPMFDLFVSWASQVDRSSAPLAELVGNIAGFATQANLLASGIVSLLPSLEALIDLVLLKQGIGLLGSIKNLALALPVAATGIQAMGIAITTYLASDKVITLVQALLEWKRAQDSLSEANERAAAISNRSSETLQRFAETTGIAAKTVDEANELVSNGTVVWSDAVNGWVRAGDAVEGLAQAAKQAQNPFEKANKAMLDAVDGSNKFGASAQATGERVLKTVPVIDAATGKIIGYEQQMVLADKGAKAMASAEAEKTKAIADAAKETEKAKEKAEQLRLEMEKLASNERIKNIEFRASIEVERIKGQTEQVRAAFDSLNVSVESTADVINKSFGLLADKNTAWEVRTALEYQIDAENKRRDTALGLQKGLTEAQIELYRAQKAQLESGDAIIKIDGSGLAPHLEAFMWEILKAVQVRANRDSSKLLLGL